MDVNLFEAFTVVAFLISTASFYFSRQKTATTQVKELENRLTSLELKIEPIWDAIRLQIPKLLISPHTREFDRLILKSIEGLNDMTAIETKRLIELLDIEYEKAIKEKDSGRAIGIALMKAGIKADSSTRGQVLIVDDNKGLCKTLSFILNKKGYTTTIASNGAEAIKLVTERPFDLILMDIRMPLMDGVEAHRRIKAIRSDAAVVMMTAYSVEDLIQQALDEGALGILHKPLDIEKIMAFTEEIR